MAQETHSKTPVPRSFKALLGVSLALNLLVAGVVIGHFANRMQEGADARGGFEAADKGRPFGRRPGMNHGRLYLKALPPKERRAILDTAREDSAASQLQDHERRVQLDLVLQALRTESFQAEDVSEILVLQAQGVKATQKRVQDAWLKHMETMTVQERNDYADRVDDLWKKHHHKGSKSE